MIDWIYISQVFPIYLDALYVTIQLSFLGIFLAFIIGSLCSVVIFYNLKFLAPLAKAYIAFFRNTPLLLQLFFIYYGLPRVGIVLEFETVAVLGLALLGGSYMAESLRGGLNAVAHNQLETSASIGLNKLQTMRYVVFPQALSYSIPNLGANCIFLFKETSVFTAIAGTDITTVAISMINLDYKTNESLFLLVGGYLVVLIPFILFLTYLEKRVRNAEFGH